MATYTTDMNWLEITEKLRGLRKSGIVFNINEAVVHVDASDEKTVVKGVYCVAALKRDNELIRLEIKYAWTVKILVTIFSCLMLGYLFSDKVTINGNPDPSWIERTGFTVLFFSAATFCFYIFFWHGKQVLKRKLETELKLKTIPNTNLEK